MKYSIIGMLNGILPDSPEYNAVIDSVNVYDPIWRLNPSTNQDEEGRNTMHFEIWLEVLSDKNDCFADMQNFVNSHTGIVTWHECTHDEAQPHPCDIPVEQTYTR